MKRVFVAFSYPTIAAVPWHSILRNWPEWGFLPLKKMYLLSTHDLLSWLSTEGVVETWLVGTEGMREMMEMNGFRTSSTEPEYVVLGYDTEITYEKIATASIHLHRGVPMVASHPDMVCPSPDGGLPDTGAYMAMFEATTGVRPVHICGKPQPGMILHKIEALGLEAERCAMVGIDFTRIWPWLLVQEPKVFSFFLVKRQWKMLRRWMRVLSNSLV